MHDTNIDKTYMEDNKEQSYQNMRNSVASIEKMIDNPMNDTTGLPADLTTDLFCNMTDSEMLSLFLPQRGMDYGFESNNTLVDQLKEKDNQSNEPIYSADDFLPHRLLPDMGRAMEACFNFIKTDSDDSLDNIIDVESVISPIPFKTSPDPLKTPEHKEESKPVALAPVEPEKKQARPIKRRKPRTYKYNPKPLQQKDVRSFVPDEFKDIDYWERRKRNNEAAKKSRRERRNKELELLNDYESIKDRLDESKKENEKLTIRNNYLEKLVLDLKAK